MFLHVFICPQRRGGGWYRGGSLPGGGGVFAQEVSRQTSPGPPEMATAAVGTNPTGMHSC